MRTLPFAIFITLAFSLLVGCQTVYARVTPEDIVNQKREAYNQRVKNYSSENKHKLETFSQKIAEVNKKSTDELSQNMGRQAQILEEYIRRTGADPRYQTDGIHRNLDNRVENARYFLTFAHEAVAFQAAKIYIFDLTNESNIKTDANKLVTQLQSDLNILRGKVIKSQNIIKILVTSNKEG